jgi:protein tyrosine phosphatase
METGATGPYNHLNRYIDVLACKIYLDERNAVKLPEFINASVVSGPDCPSQEFQYIATQGPLPHTVFMFWKMVWVFNCESIFMLCSPMECQIVC